MLESVAMLPPVLTGELHLEANHDEGTTSAYYCFRLPKGVWEVEVNGVTVTARNAYVRIKVATMPMETEDSVEATTRPPAR